MRRKWVVKAVCSVSTFSSSLVRLLLLTGFVLNPAGCTSVAGQQTQPSMGSIDPSQFAQAQSLADILNDEAAATDSVGIHRYSEHLIKLLVPDRAGKKYIRSLTDRLARAEELTRARKGNLVPEAKVAEAYNDLMKKVGAPTSLLTDEAAVRALRRIPFEKASDAFITTSRNGTNCNPGEATFLLLALIWNNGGPRVPLERTPGNAQTGGTTSGPWFSGEVRSPSNPSAGRSIDSYSAAHRPRETTALFDEVARTLGF